MMPMRSDSQKPTAAWKIWLALILAVLVGAGIGITCLLLTKAMTLLVSVLALVAPYFVMALLGAILLLQVVAISTLLIAEVDPRMRGILLKLGVYSLPLSGAGLALLLFYTLLGITGVWPLLGIGALGAVMGACLTFYLLHVKGVAKSMKTLDTDLPHTQLSVLPSKQLTAANTAGQQKTAKHENRAAQSSIPRASSSRFVGSPSFRVAAPIVQAYSRRNLNKFPSFRNAAVTVKAYTQQSDATNKGLFELLAKNLQLYAIASSGYYAVKEAIEFYNSWAALIGRSAAHAQKPLDKNEFLIELIQQTNPTASYQEARERTSPASLLVFFAVILHKEGNRDFFNDPRIEDATLHRFYQFVKAHMGGLSQNMFKPGRNKKLKNSAAKQQQEALIQLYNILRTGGLRDRINHAKARGASGVVTVVALGAAVALAAGP